MQKRQKLCFCERKHENKKRCAQAQRFCITTQAGSEGSTELIPLSPPSVAEATFGGQSPQGSAKETFADKQKKKQKRLAKYSRSFLFKLCVCGQSIFLNARIVLTMLVAQATWKTGWQGIQGERFITQHQNFRFR